MNATTAISMTVVGFAMGIGWMALYLACWPGTPPTEA